MAKKSGTAYVSKGQRPNVSRKLINAARMDRRANPTIHMILARMANRNEVAKRQDRGSKEAFQRILDKESMHYQAITLYDKYKTAFFMARTENGEDRRSYCTWSACVQAVKTDYVASFQAKWAPRLSSNLEDEIKIKKSQKR